MSSCSSFVMFFPWAASRMYLASITRGVGREANVTTSHVETARLIESLIAAQAGQ
jgi:hypothetical protein